MTLLAVVALALTTGCENGAGAPAWDAIVETSTDLLDTSSDPGTDPPADTSIDLEPDTGIDPSGDTSEDDGAEEPGEPWSMCAQSCTSAAECCSAGSPCGTYPNSWACDGWCRGTGCADDAECQAWATGLGLSGASAYRCRGYSGSFASCVQGCTSAADCCPVGITCTSYPYRYDCAAGGCLMDECTGDEECRSYASTAGLARADSYVCADTGVWRYCAPSCSTPADCCTTGSCTAYPQHWDCRSGLCAATCSDSAECTAYASSAGLAHADSWACFDF